MQWNRREDEATGYGQLLGDFWRLAWPAILRNTFNCAADRMTLAFVGHYDPARPHYDGASLGKMYSNITGLSVGFGVCLGLATLCSQANGAGQGKQVNGLYLWRCMVIFFFAFFYSATAALLCERFLLAFSQPADVALCSARYAQVQLIGVPFFWIAQALQTVCDGGLQDTTPGMYAGLVSAIFQVGMCAVCVHPALLNWGYLGMAAARSAGGVVSVAVIVGVVLANDKQAEVWKMPRGGMHGDEGGTSSRSGSTGATSTNSRVRLLYEDGIPRPRSAQRLQQRAEPLLATTQAQRVCSCSGLAQFLGVAWPGAVMMWLEWWSFEGFSVMVGTLPRASILLAAHGTMFNILVVTYMCFTGLNSALCSTVGKHIGAGSAGKAVPRLITIALLFALGFASAIAASLMTLRDEIARFFETDRAVVDAIDKNLLGAALSVPGYGVLMTLYGACQGANRQRPAFAGTALGYASGIPLAWYLGCKRHWPRPLLGIWLGNVWALGFASAWILVLVCCCTSWKRIRAVDSSSNNGSPPLGGEGATEGGSASGESSLSSQVGCVESAGQINEGWQVNNLTAPNVPSLRDQRIVQTTDR